MREVGGRKLPHETGTRKYDSDEFRGQRRRPWMFFRVGEPTRELPTDSLLQFIMKVHKAMIDNGILLDDETERIKCTFVGDDYRQWVNELQDGLQMVDAKYEKGPLSRPIVILILDQFDQNEVENVTDHFSPYMWFFKLERSEVIEMINDYDYSVLEDLCVEFSQLLVQSEGFLESKAFKMEVEERVERFGDWLDVGVGQEKSVRSRRHGSPSSFESKQLPRYQNKLNNKMQRNLHSSNLMPPPGVPPPGLEKRCQNVQYTKSHLIDSPPGLHRSNSSRTSERCDADIAPPPGIALSKPPGIEVHISGPRPNVISENEHSQVDEVPIKQEIEGDHILSLTDVCTGRSMIVDNRKSSQRGVPFTENYGKLSKYIDGSKLYERLRNPFASLASNLDLLYLINYAVSTREKTVHKHSKEILKGAFLSRFPSTLKQRFLDGPIDNGRWSDDSATMYFELVALFFYTARFKGMFLESLHEFLPAWKNMARSYDEVTSDSLKAVGASTEELSNLKKLIRQVDKWIEAAELKDPNETTITIPPQPEDYYDRPEMYQPPTQPPVHYVAPEEIYDRLRRYERSFSKDNYPDENRRDNYRDPSRRERSNEYGRDETDFVEDRGRRSNYEERDTRRYEYLGFQNGGGAADTKNMDEWTSSEQTVIQKSGEHREVLENKKGEVKLNELVVDTDQKEQQKYKYHDESGTSPLWMRCQSGKPPEDFKTLPSTPRLSDYVNPVEPFLRRIEERENYHSAHDLLDAQFRLMREDLISPLRDGIDLYRKNGTCKGRRIEGTPCSDVAIFNLERVEGKQVSERDGFEMRVAYPAPYDISKLLENDKEMKELGLVMLSKDQFVDDFHLAYVQTSLLISRGCLHLVILEETGPFVLNTSYQMAQGSSYFPSYKHVLENMRNINPFVPIPFERYIVSRKTPIFRPAFHRHEKCSEQIAEERRLEAFYKGIRDAVAIDRVAHGKPVPTGFDEEDNEDYENRSSVRPRKGEEDLVYEQLKVPIFKPQLGPPPRGSDTIKIGERLYDISRLLDQYQPDNLDESQRVAFASVFRQEFTLIQGPPGTGKTHIGVQILKTMLENRSHWRIPEPILIICYTNSGLDNLLERTYQMIENDEELSKDSSRPRMIRYGRKCESEFLKRRQVMSWDVRENFKQNIPDGIQREQAKAGAQKRRKGDALAVSSYTLYCSRNELISYELLSRVMDPSHQMEFVGFAGDHVDSKDRLLCNDEALACWLLDRDFGRPSKAQSKKKNTSKFKANMEDSSDDESPALNVEISDDEEYSELNDEEILDKIFKKMNLECTGNDVLNNVTEHEQDEYHTRSKWEIAADQNLHLVVLMGKKDKNGHPVDESISSLVKEVKDMILMSPPLPKEELPNVKYVWSLTRPKRWALYQNWCAALRKLIAENLPKQIQEYRLACKEMQKALNNSDAEIMKMPMIIGATTTGCSRLRPLLEKVKPRILIVEEAAEVFESHILSAMVPSIEQVVMIGDHQQLRPKPAVHELAVEYGLHFSMFERLISGKFPYCQLRQQHRMNTTIADMIVRPSFYNNVHDAPNVLDYPDVEGMNKNLFFWSHTVKEETPDGISWMNKQEVEMSASLVKYLLKQNYTNRDIVVITTYSAQRSYMYREYPSIFGPHESQLIPVETVDSYQGRECKIVIVSLVRSHRGVPENSGIGFLAVANRICVALTRAQHGMYIVGNGAYLMNNSKLWDKIGVKLTTNRLIDYDLPLKCVAHKNITMIGSPSEFDEKSPGGGCHKICDMKKECGHVCQRPCHPRIDQEHSRPCEYKCMKTCPDPRFNHECTKRCYEDCGSCMFFVEVDLECGHRITTPCSRVSMARCDQKCHKTLVCGHRCLNECGMPCIEAGDCRQKVNIELSCGHLKELVCGEVTSGGNLNMDCVERCEERMLLCEHQCAELCGKQCTVECPEIVTVTLNCGHEQHVVCSNIGADKSTSHISCESLVPQLLEPCGHTENILCGSVASSVQCNQRCEHLLEKCGHRCGDDCGKCFKTGVHQCQQRCQVVMDCGHGCSARCGEPCPPCKAFCKNSCEHQSCGPTEKGFGRDCNELCALCFNPCGNKCKHRSCPLKCYEECNIKPCAEMCSEKLKCGHACLGLCGEICPRVCGTCERAKYLECVSNMSSQKVHCLLMVPKCHHTFPVEFVDEHVKKLKEQNEQLTCPKCPMLLNGVWRYARYSKKRVIDSNMKKLRRRVKEIDSNTLLNRAKLSYQKIGSSDIMRKPTNITMDVIGVIVQFQGIVTEITNKIGEVSEKAPEKWRFHFLVELMSCLESAYSLLTDAYSSRVVQRKKVPPMFDLLIHNVFTSLPFPKFIKEFTEMNETIATTWKTGLLGVIMPKLRFQLAKLYVLRQLSLLCSILIDLGKDLTEQEAKNIKTSVLRLFEGTERQHLNPAIEAFENHTLKIAQAGSLKHQKKLIPWKSLNIPNF